MKKFYWLFMLFFLIISIPNSVKAYCDYNELARLKKIATNVTHSVEYIEKDNNVEFIVTLVNLHPDIYIKDTIKNTFYYYSDAGKETHEIVISGYKPGNTIKYEVYNVQQPYCDIQVLLDKYVTLPPFNPFYNDAVCADAEEYRLCQKWVEVKVDYATFKKEVEKYKRGRDKNLEDEPKDDLGNVGKFLSFFVKYYIYILGAIILVCLILIYRINKKNSFDFS